MAMPMKFTKTFTDWDRLPVLLDLETVCCLLRCADTTAVKYIKNGAIKGNKFGNKWLVDRDSVRDYFQRKLYGIES